MVFDQICQEIPLGRGVCFGHSHIVQQQIFFYGNRTFFSTNNLSTTLGVERQAPLGWVVGALPPHPRTVDLKVSKMSAFGPPQGCASGSLWGNINKYW